jgi:hypothetical protein
MSPEEIHAKVVATRASQGLPPTVIDPATVERVAAVFRLITSADESTPPKPRKRRSKPPATRSDQEGSAA